LSRLAIVSMARFRVLTACDVDCGCVPSVRFIYRFYSLNFQFQSISASDQPTDQPSIRPSNPTHPFRSTHRHRSALRSIRRRASSCGVCDCDESVIRRVGYSVCVCVSLVVWWCGDLNSSLPMAGVVAGARACVKNNIAASLRPALLPVSSVVNRPSHPPPYTRVRALPRRRRIDRIVGVVWYCTSTGTVMLLCVLLRY
jgi:hypothetical protein